MSIYERIKLDWSPKEIDLYLQTRYSYSLWHFSVYLNWWFFLFLLDLPAEDYLRKKESNTSWVKYWNSKIQGLENLKKYNIKKLQNIVTESQFNHPIIKKSLISLPYMQSSYKHIMRSFNLTPYFQRIDEMIYEIKNGILKMKQMPAKSLHLIAYIWSFFIREHNRACLIDIINLMKWFAFKTQFSKKFNFFFEGIDTLKSRNLSIQFYRYKKKPFLKTLIEQQKYIYDYNYPGFYVSFGHFGLSSSALGYQRIEMGKTDSLILSFPNGEDLTLADYNENRKKATL